MKNNFNKTKIESKVISGIQNDSGGHFTYVCLGPLTSLIIHV